MATKMTNPYDRLIGLLIGRAHVRYGRGIIEPWSAASGVSTSTLARRLQKPEKMTLEELHKLARPLGISSMEIREALPI